MHTPRLHHLDFGPEDLPPVSPIDLRKAWRAAHVAAEVGLTMEPGDIEGVDFRDKGGAESRFVFSDLDAACWAAAVDRTYDLGTANGVSLLFRLLALIELIADAPWLRPFYSLSEKDGAALAPALLAAAAAERLTNTAAFDTPAFKAAMGLAPPPATEIPTGAAGTQRLAPATAPRAGKARRGSSRARRVRIDK